MLENEAWELVEKPENKRIVKSKWVFTKKKDNEGNVVRHKARLVAKGCSQTQGIDYEDTFSPVVRNSTVRVLFAIAAELDLEIDHLDVSTAFLNGELEETVYMYQPDGFIEAGNENKVCLLKKAIYGLKQSARVWHKKAHDVLINLGFKQSDHEVCVYYKSSENGMIIIALYVDDFLMLSNDESERIRVKEELMRKFKIKDLGEVKQFLGMRVQRNREEKEIKLDQTHYIEEILKRFGMKDSKPVTTPMCANQKLSSETVNSTDETANIPYQQVIGSLMYLAVWTRPDIAYAISYLSQFNTCYTDEHWKLTKRVLRYLRGTTDMGLLYKQTGENLIGYADADWGTDVADRKSYSGFVFKLGNAGVAWEARKQRTVALSSTEAEYIAISESAKEAIHLQGLLSELIGQSGKITIFNDSQSAQKLVLNPVFHNRTKHIDIRYHFIRGCVEDNKIVLQYVPTEKMPADMLTKSLPNPKHKFCCVNVGLV